MKKQQKEQIRAFIEKLPISTGDKSSISIFVNALCYKDPKVKETVEKAILDIINVTIYSSEKPD